MAPRTQENSLLTTLLGDFLIKGYNSGTARCKRCTGQGKGEGVWSFHCPLWAPHHPAPPRAQQTGSSPNSTLGFLGRFHQVGMIDSPLVIKLNLQPLSLLRERRGGAWKFQHFGWFPWQPAPNLRGFTKRHLININSGVVETGLLGIRKGSPFSL